MGLYRLAMERCSRKKGMLLHAEEILSRKNTVTDIFCGSPEAPVPFERPFIIFHAFAEETGIERMGILFPAEGVYGMYFSHGFDMETVSEFESSASFWPEAIRERGWYQFSGEELSVFLRFFSAYERQNLTKLYIKSFIQEPDTVCYLIIAESLLNVSRKQKIDPNTLDIVFPALHALINSMMDMFPEILSGNAGTDKISLHIESAVNGGLTGTMFQITLDLLAEGTDKRLTEADRKLLLRAAAFLIRKAFGVSNIVYTGDSGILYGILFGNKEIDGNLYAMQLDKLVLSYFPQSRHGDLIVTGLGSSLVFQDLYDFIFRN